MQNFNVGALVAMYQRMVSDVVPDRVLADEVRQAVSALNQSELRDLDQALCAAGIDKWLAAATPVADEGEWVDDGRPVPYSEEIGRKGRAYLEEMIAKGPVGLGNSLG